MTQIPGVTVGRLLQSHPETLGLDLEILSGNGGLDRRITSPYVQKTGFAQQLAARLEHQSQLAGRDELDESEIEEIPGTGEEP